MEEPKMRQEELTLRTLLSSLSTEEKESLKKYYTTGEQDNIWWKLLNDRKFFISLGVALKNEGINDEDTKKEVLDQIG